MTTKTCTNGHVMTGIGFDECPECEAPWMTAPTVEEIREKFADIEHQRWSDWMGYVFDKCGNPEIGKDAVIPFEFADRWGRQMNTEYADLTEAEKKSDRDQVDRYWNLVTTYGNARYEEGVKAERERCKDLVVAHLRTNTYDGNDARVFKTTIEEVVSILDKI